MKRFALMILLTIVGLSIGRAESPYSSDPGDAEAKLRPIETSLQNALESGNPGLQASAAQVAREVEARFPRYDFSALIIPLMRILKNEDGDAGTRILAALALHDLRSARGDYAIQGIAASTDDQRLKHLCRWLVIYRAKGYSSFGPGATLIATRPK